MTAPSDVIRLLRPTQWVKNAFVVAPLVFSEKMLDPVFFFAAAAGFVAFCLASSSAYIVNDVVDAARDRAHPLKCRRPVAAGRVSPRAALAAAAGLAAAALGLGPLMRIGWTFTAVLTAYLILQIAYTAVLKKVVVVDAMAIAIGFVLRVVAGVVAVDARMSAWMFLTTFLLALFLALAKRRQELALLGDQAGLHRDVLLRYRESPLDALVVGLAVMIIAVYVQYTLSHEVAVRLGTGRLYLTVPFVVFGVFRYLFLIYRRSQGDDPTATLLGDGLLQGGVVLWGLTVLALLYS